MKSLGLLVLLCSAGVARADDPKIIDKPIRYDDERTKLTVEYRQRHQDPAATDSRIAPKMIVLHYTDGGSMEATWNYFDPSRIGDDRPVIAKAGKLNVSAHFIVDRDGTIYRLVPETSMARHTIGLNHIAIGIENVGDLKKYKLTDAQVAADAALIRYLVGKYGITHLIGHLEADRMMGTPFWLEREASYHNGNDDPGGPFMARVREQVADLKLQGPPGGK